MTNEEFIKSVSLEGEIWKDVVGYEGCYVVSNYGRVASLLRHIKHPNCISKTVNQRLLSLKTCKNGYISVCLYKDGKSKNPLVHRLVATAFIPNHEHKPQIDHIDRNRSNNHVSNLRWCTRSENMLNPLTRPILKQINKGRIRTYAYHPVVALKGNTLIYKFEKLMDCQNYGFNYTVVSSICSGRRKTHKGFTFMYLSDYENLINNSNTLNYPSCNI